MRITKDFRSENNFHSGVEALQIHGEVHVFVAACYWIGIMPHKGFNSHGTWLTEGKNQHLNLKGLCEIEGLNLKNPFLPPEFFRISEQIKEHFHDDYKHTILWGDVNSMDYYESLRRYNCIVDDYERALEFIQLASGGNDIITMEALEKWASKDGRTSMFQNQADTQHIEEKNNSYLDASTESLLQLAREAAYHFWGGVTEEAWRNASSRQGKNKDPIIAWLKERGLNSTRANSLDVLLRPEFARHGGNVSLREE